jgi:hypothetical protein
MLTQSLRHRIWILAPRTSSKLGTLPRILRARLAQALFRLNRVEDWPNVYLLCTHCLLMEVAINGELVWILL